MLLLESLLRHLNDQGGRYLARGLERKRPGRLPPDREALLKTTLALSIERVAWLEQMMAIAMDSGALPKRVPDQLAGARPGRSRGP